MHISSKINFALATLALAAGAQASGISTGSDTGTYYAMGKDIARACPALRLDIHPSEGSLANLSRVFKDANTQYGFVQQDALLYRNLKDAGLMKNIMMLFPLFDEEIHVVGVPGIRSLQDLQGKRVIVGVEGSGNWVTSQIIKSKTGITWTDMQAPPQQALTSLLLGQADAMIYVGGAPIKALTEMGSSAKGKLVLVPLSHPNLESFYTQNDIPSGTYAWQSTGVRTYSVKSVLMTYNYRAPKMQDEIRSLVSCLVDKLPEMQAGNYHTKWREVDPLSITQVDWQVHPSALELIKRYKK